MINEVGEADAFDMKSAVYENGFMDGLDKAYKLALKMSMNYDGIEIADAIKKLIVQVSNGDEA
jgi:hypothetical protein